ncbi:MAG: hypothetical protein J6V72_15030 [Kiritimatiellae bacterium]|nr:hypothetical protein [Kiritimatiellia bacterium]
MRKAVEEYLKGRGCCVERPPEEPAPLTLGGLVDGFLVHVLRLDSESYRRAFWREAYRNGHTIGHVPRTFEAFFRRNAHTFEQRVSLFLAVTALFGVYTVLILLVMRLSLFIRRLRRPTYYERERERRRKLADARREIRKHHTLNPQPTFDAIRAALRVARSSPEAALRLGSLLEDLECFVDNTLLFDGQGRIVGRKGGIKRLLQREAPDLFEKYSTIMRYKATAKRFRQACGTGEPVPPAMLLPAQEAAVADDLQAGLARAREAAREILGECEGTVNSLEAALALRLDPDCIPASGEYVRTPGRPRVPKRVVGWLARRRVA